jgi:hypothetical protein
MQLPVVSARESQRPAAKTMFRSPLAAAISAAGAFVFLLAACSATPSDGPPPEMTGQVAQPMRTACTPHPWCTPCLPNSKFSTGYSLTCSNGCGSSDTEACTPPPPLPPRIGRASQGLSWFQGMFPAGQMIDYGESLGRAAYDGGMEWHDANTVEMLADYTLATGDTRYLSNLQAYENFDGEYNQGNNCSGDFFGCGPGLGVNGANDDNLWWALAKIRIYDVMKSFDDPSAGNYLSNAEEIFAHTCSQWRGPASPAAIDGPGISCGGGVPWQSNDGYQNAITNELFMETAAKLALRDPGHQNVCGFQPVVEAPPGFTDIIPGEPAVRTWTNTYLGWAAAQWTWFHIYWFPEATCTNPEVDCLDYGSPPNAAHLPIVDGLGADCIPGHAGSDPSKHSASSDSSVWTYNQGVILGALLDMATLAKTHESLFDESPETMRHFAYQVATSAMAHLSEKLGTGDSVPLALRGAAILTEKRDDDPNNGCFTDQDCSQFKGIFMRYLGRLLSGASPDATHPDFAPTALKFLDDNATEIWNNGVAEGKITTSETYGADNGLIFLGLTEVDFPVGGAFPEKWTVVQNPPPQQYQQAQTSALDALIADIQDPCVACQADKCANGICVERRP